MSSCGVKCAGEHDLLPNWSLNQTWWTSLSFIHSVLNQQTWTENFYTVTLSNLKICLHSLTYLSCRSPFSHPWCDIVIVRNYKIFYRWLQSQNIHATVTKARRVYQKKNGTENRTSRDSSHILYKSCTILIHFSRPSTWYKKQTFYNNTFYVECCLKKVLRHVNGWSIETNTLVRTL